MIMKDIDGVEIDVMPVGTKVRFKNNPEITGEIISHEYHSKGVISALPYKVYWDIGRHSIYPNPDWIELVDTKRELEFIGCAQSAKFLYEKVESAAGRGYGVLVEPVGGENNRAFNLYQLTPSLAKSAPDMYGACEAIEYLFTVSNQYWLGHPVTALMVREALAKARVK